MALAVGRPESAAPIALTAHSSDVHSTQGHHDEHDGASEIRNQPTNEYIQGSKEELASKHQKTVHPESIQEKVHTRVFENVLVYQLMLGIGTAILHRHPCRCAGRARGRARPAALQT